MPTVQLLNYIDRIVTSARFFYIYYFLSILLIARDFSKKPFSHAQRDSQPYRNRHTCLASFLFIYGLGEFSLLAIADCFEKVYELDKLKLQLQNQLLFSPGRPPYPRYFICLEASFLMLKFLYLPYYLAIHLVLSVTAN